MNAPATFQIFINDILKEYLNKFVLVYINNILIYLDTFEEHVKYIEKVLRKLEQVGLYLKLLKYDFYKKQVRFLGFIISDKGLEIDPKKVKSIIK